MSAGEAAPAKRNSLRFELAAALAAVLMMAVVSLAFAGEWLAGRRHASLETTRLREHARGLALVVTPMVVPATPGSAEQVGVEQALRPSLGTSGIVAIELWRLGPDGAVDRIAALGVPPDLRDVAAPPFDAEDTVAERPPWTVVDRPLRSFGAASKHRVWLRLVARTPPFTSDADWRQIALLALGVGGIAFVLGVGLLELQVLRPLAALHRRVGEVAKGDLAVRADPQGPRELQAFATAFNEMTERLSARIDELAAQRTELARAEQLASVGRIAAGTAHEVGNPLATILGYVELLLDPRHEPPLDATSRGMLERVREQIVRITSLVGQLLDYSRAGAVNLASIDLRASADRMVALLEPDPRCAGVAFAVEGASVHAAADAALLDQVLHNLLVNGARAAKRHADAARVVVRIVDGAAPAIEVQDNGPGIAPQVRARLFEPFVTTAKAGEGTGLGLAISAGLVGRMGGSIDCLADGALPALGRDDSPGAVFRVTLRPADDLGTSPNADGATPV